MAPQREGYTSSVLMAALIGGLVGVTVGLILAPKPGKELRRELTAEGKELIDELRQLAEEIRGVKNGAKEGATGAEMVEIS